MASEKIVPPKNAQNQKNSKAKKKDKKANKKPIQQNVNLREIIKVKFPQLEGKDSFGDYETIKSQSLGSQKWVELSEVENYIGETVLMRLRIHRSRKKSNKMAFFLFRKGMGSIQGILLETADLVTRDMVKYCSKIKVESVVDIVAEVKKSDVPIKSATYSEIELVIHKMFVVSASEELPFQLDNASKKFSSDKQNDGKDAATVTRSLRLDHRYIDLRSNASQAIMKVKSEVCQFYRSFLLEKGFTEIQTPKIVPGVSEGGADVFRLDYFNQKACLAQSPQLYKQMAVNSGLEKVFEIGPVFRAENTNTNRHLTEFVGMDLEMALNEFYFEVMQLTGDLFTAMFKKLSSSMHEEISVVQKIFDTENLVFLENFVKLEYKTAVDLLLKERERLVVEGKNKEEILEFGAEVEENKDFSTPNEKLLGKLVKEKYKTDFYVVYRYPKEARPFYTMPDSEDSQYTNSFDFFLRGEEIISGAQRIHEVELLSKRAEECGVPLESLGSYLNSFKYGATPHGGMGAGLERVVMLFMGVNNIRECTIFSRDPKRLSP